MNERKKPKQKPDPTIRTEIYPKKSQAFERQQAILAGMPYVYHRKQQPPWQSSERNKELIRGFQQYLFAQGTGSYRVAKLTGYLRHICDQLGKDLDTVTREDIERFVAELNRSSKAEHTKRDNRRTLKQFYGWFESRDPRLKPLAIPDGKLTDEQILELQLKQQKQNTLAADIAELYRYIKKDVKGKAKPQSLDYSSMLTDEDFSKLITDGCKTSMQRAIVAVMSETGCRIGELLGVRICDVEEKDLGEHRRYAMLRVDGKTHERRVPIIQSLPYIRKWLADHPYKNNPRALLWISTHYGHYGEPIRYYGIKRMLSKIFKRAGVDKKCNAHHFRHSRATLNAPQYSESVLCKMMGWSVGSRQVRTYVHLNDANIANLFLEAHGIELSSAASKLTHQ
jgi:integrase